ncbi:hypothetical protein NSED_03460 [Candidatus Nitrosopumilus sediminis]|uniref:Sigma 54 modulation protein/ribosomal protein S30EA n=2 Tax=Candidatus Nitrosopumilus sediminis TaxID=1229909 RepID=K0B8L7_9ARCH|nr:hypothetical protein NSED_03460 [Candidatus Nitrosopumilus sediminis]
MFRLIMAEKVPLFVIGLAKDEPANEVLSSKFGSALEKVQQVLPHIIEAKIAVESQNTEGSRTHYEVTATVKTSGDRLIYTESGWDILKIADDLSRKLERELPKHDDKRQRDSIRKKEY